MQKKNLATSILISFKEKHNVGWNICPCYSCSMSFEKSHSSQMAILLKIAPGWLHCLFHARAKQSPLPWRWEWESGHCCTGLTYITADMRQKLMWISLLIALVLKAIIYFQTWEMILRMKVWSTKQWNWNPSEFVNYIQAEFFLLSIQEKIKVSVQFLCLFSLGLRWDTCYGITLLLIF